MDIDLDALDKALSPKRRKQDQPKSWKELYDEARRLARDYYGIFLRPLCTRHGSKTYMIDGGGVLWQNYHHDSWKNRDRVHDIDKVPIQVFKQFIANGRRRLKGYYEMIDRVVQQIPEIVLEANLEGKVANSEVLRYAYIKRLEQLNEVINRRVENLADVTMDLSFNLCMKEPLSGQDINIEIHWDSLPGIRVSVQGVSSRPRKPDDVVKLAYFLTCFEQVAEEINQQLDKIKMKGR